MGRFLDWIFARLARVTSGGKLVREIDGLRFVAITAVVIDHYDLDLIARVHYDMSRYHNEFWEWFFHNGGVGVQLFFVISGFVLALPFAQHFLLKKPAPKLGRYYLRRLTRLEPPYILNMLLVAGMRFFLLHQAFSYLMPHLVASLLYVHNITYARMSAINQVAWSLEVEVQFYMLAPLLARVYMLQGKNLRRLVMIATGMAFAIAQTAVPQGTWFTNHFTLSILFHIQFFLAGFLLVDIYLMDWKQAPEKGASGTSYPRSHGWPSLRLCATVSSSRAYCRSQSWLPTLGLSVAYSSTGCSRLGASSRSEVCATPSTSTI